MGVLRLTQRPHVDGLGISTVLLAECPLLTNSTATRSLVMDSPAFPLKSQSRLELNQDERLFGESRSRGVATDVLSLRRDRD